MGGRQSASRVEVLKAFDNFATNKSPGPDGFLAETSKTFQSLLPITLQLMKLILRLGGATDASRRVYLALLADSPRPIVKIIESVLYRCGAFNPARICLSESEGSRNVPRRVDGSAVDGATCPPIAGWYDAWRGWGRMLTAAGLYTPG